MEDLQMRSFNSEGIDEMRKWLSEVRGNPNTTKPSSLAVSDTFTSPIGKPIASSIFDTAAFQTKLSLAAAIDSAVVAAGLDEELLETNQGFWSWLAFFFSEKLIGAKGKVGADALWLFLPGNWMNSYRQKLAPLWLTYRTHRSNAQNLKGVLGVPVNKTGEVFEQMMSRKWIVLSPGLMELITRLYFDEATEKLKRGAGGKEAGSARRLTIVLEQLRLTYDIEQLGWEALSKMLPNDFRKFLPAQA
ncbi:hypothetical protein M2397_002312 [Pseudomonas sp. BIGb0381]|uniref:hypothetical protein n=1 Tax=Pseudomonas sp. BIGb0381 TaxID=2940608 RepID=UPI002167985C|nr:hypothetical protein [Pseudomonas sp. BIGb0381]MCS4312017.1 hypothetical protein [Pseudomonas sp. BIGb0381]